MGYLIFETQKYEIPKKQSPIKKKRYALLTGTTIITASTCV